MEAELPSSGDEGLSPRSDISKITNRLTTVFVLVEPDDDLHVPEAWLLLSWRWLKVLDWQRAGALIAYCILA